MSQRYIGGLIYNPPGGFSGYFDGSGDYLTIADNIALDMEGSDFTIEGWIFPVVSSGGSVGVFSKRASGAVVGGVLLYYDGAGLTPSLLIGSGGSWVINQASSIAFGLGQWNHFAVVRNGTSFVLYINGVAGVSATSSSSVTDNSAAFAIGAWAADGTGAISASYFSNFRVVKGTALYTAAFTPPVGPLQAITNTSLLTCAYPTFRDGSSNNFTITVNGNTAVSTQNPFPLTQLPVPALGNAGNGVYSMSQYQALKQQNLWPSIDQYWPYVTLMLHGNGTNGAQNNTFLDSSTNNFTITRNGNTTQGTFTPYGSNWSNYFKSGDYLGFNSNSAFNMNTYCCLEAWVCYTSLSSSTLVVGRDSSYWIGYDFAGIGGAASKFVFAILNTGSSWQAVSSTTSPVVGVWYHVVGIKDNTTLRIYINGVQENTATFSGTAVTTSNVVQIAANQGTQPMVGYISNTRLVLGASASVLPYTGNFTPPTAPLTAVSGTAFLTCQSNRFVDNSSNAFSVIVNNTPSVQRFSPFNPTTPYAAGTIGGSGYFDAGGDYLSTNYTINWSTYGSYTLEFWIYHTTMSPTNQWYFVGGTGGTGNTVFYNYANGRVGVGIIGTNEITSASGVIKANTWQHVAYTYNGTTTKIYVDGVEVASGTTAIYANSSVALSVGGGSASASDAMNGYMANLRLSQSVIYTTAFTPPTSPVTGGALLMNFTNGGIIDNAMMNDLETVGNAQISTSVSKFGGGSLAFDGSGDYLFAPSRATTSLEGDFTIEYWIYRSVSGSTSIFTLGDSFTASGIETYIGSSGTAFLLFSGNATRISSSSLPAVGAWSHVAAVRSGSTITLYLNGVSLGTWSSSTTFSGALYVGTEFYNGSVSGSLNGYIDDLRITKYARYTANFTPQRSQWQDQ